MYSSAHVDSRSSLVDLDLEVGSVVKRRIFLFMARIFYLEFCTWTQFLIGISKKKARGQRPDLVNAHKSQNKKPWCFFSAVRSESGFPHQAFMARKSLFQAESLS